MRVQFTVRRLMIAIALVAILIVSVQQYRWAKLMRYRAWKYTIAADIERSSREYAEDWIDMPLTLQSKRDAAKRKAAWHAKRERLYREAVLRPWIDVPSVPEPRFD